MNRWGLTLPLPQLPLRDHADLVRRAEAAGYTDLWSGETNGPDGFTPLALRPRRGPRARGSGPGWSASSPAGRRCSRSRPRRSRTLSGGRFALGIGASSDRIVEGWNDMPFSKPLTRIAETRRLPATPPSPASEPRRASSSSRSPAEPPPIILAALRGKMLRLAVERAAGAFTNFLPLAGLPRVTEQLEGAPDGFELLCRFFCLPGEREQVEPLARFMFASYATVPVYEAFFRWLGYGEQIDDMVAAWAREGPRGGDRGRALGA